MIVETLVTTCNGDGSVNIAPMGAVVNDGWQRFELRPFIDTTTYQNLTRTGFGVLHLTDNPIWFASAVVGRWAKMPELTVAERVPGWRLAEAQQAFEFELAHTLSEPPRSSLQCRTLGSSPLQSWTGLCRATGAVIECAIAATRLQFLPAAEVQGIFARGAQIISKTGGPREQQAFQLLLEFTSERGMPLQEVCSLST